MNEQEGPPVKTEGEVGGAPAASEAHGTDAYDEEQGPFFRYPRQYPSSGRASREEAREERIAGHVQRHRARGAQPPRRDRGLSRGEIVQAAIAVAGFRPSILREVASSWSRDRTFALCPS